MRQERRLVRNFLDYARLARRDLTQDGRARRSARHRHFIHVRGEFLRPGVDYNRRAADHDRAWHRLAQRAVLLPVKISARASDTRGHAHAEPVGFFQRCAVGPHVADTGLGIARNAKRGSEIGRGVETRSGNRHRQARQPATRPPQIFALDDHFLAQRGIYQDRGNRVGNCSRPSRADLFDLTAHANRINLGRSGERPDDHRNIVAPSVRVDDIGEQKSAAVFLWNAAQKLAPHEWMQLGVFVDWPFNTNEQAVRFELSEVRLEIKAWPGNRLLSVPSHRNAPAPYCVEASTALPIPQIPMFVMPQEEARTSSEDRASARPKRSLTKASFTCRGKSRKTVILSADFARRIPLSLLF